jgi:deaminated glutathione amidase
MTRPATGPERSGVIEGREIKAAAIQMSSTPDKDDNLETAERLIRAAASSGADLIALPELWSCHGLEKVYRENAEPVPGPTTMFLGNLASELGVYVLGGSILEDDPSSPKLHNTSTFFTPDGEMSAVYRKIHLFDVKAPDREYLESKTIGPGTEVVTAKAGVATLGLSVCYDVRFPELYRLLTLRGAEVMIVPAAFTLQTGKDHWALLLQARAVENQAFVVAPAQWGQKADGRWTYGRSLIVDPWGTVLAQCPDRAGTPSPPSTSTTLTVSAKISPPSRTVVPRHTTGKHTRDSWTESNERRGPGRRDRRCSGARDTGARERHPQTLGGPERDRDDRRLEAFEEDPLEGGDVRDGVKPSHRAATDLEPADEPFEGRGLVTVRPHAHRP